ncbi:MAG: UDP-N-acetylmuramoyl-tripeptide--D-alanyl-D-alanine ligase [Actinomycetota bacterium]
MRERKLSEIAAAVSGRQEGGDAVVRGVATDSREVTAGDLFVALSGDRVDGHRYIVEAMANGATAALVSEPPSGLPCVVVGDTAAALMILAKDERGAVAGTVIGITGSTGKTSVKDLTASVLASRFEVSSSPRSFNTEIGVPLTLLNAPAIAEVIIVEMGSRGLGHIATLCEVARPQIGVVTGVGLAHMEMFGSLEAVADAKAELVQSLPEDGTAVLNADDPIVRGFDSRTKAGVQLYGVGSDAQVRGGDVVLDAEGRASFTLRAQGGEERVELQVLGEHMVWNALAASAVGVALGLTVGECAAGLKDARLSPWRMELFQGAGGIRIVNDAYNANPSSMAAALKAVRWIAKDARSIAVLGEMAELGEMAPVEHERVGELVARLGIDHLIVVGNGAAAIAIGAEREGVEPERIARVGTVAEAVEAVQKLARKDDVVLLKGSRVVGLERAAEALG